MVFATLPNVPAYQRVGNPPVRLRKIEGYPMSDEDFVTELGSILSCSRDEIVNGVLELVKRKVEETPPLTAAEIVRAIESSGIVHRTMLDWANRWVANEVANRLRCGIWDGTTVGRLFDTIWTEQFDVAIKDRIRQKANAAIDAVIKERLATLR
jgi:hypothetical protein